jgi:hypothetical protein
MHVLCSSKVESQDERSIQGKERPIQFPTLRNFSGKDKRAISRFAISHLRALSGAQADGREGF